MCDILLFPLVVTFRGIIEEFLLQSNSLTVCPVWQSASCGIWGAESPSSSNKSHKYLTKIKLVHHRGIIKFSFNCYRDLWVAGGSHCLSVYKSLSQFTAVYSAYFCLYIKYISLFKELLNQPETRPPGFVCNWTVLTRNKVSIIINTIHLYSKEKLK